MAEPQFQREASSVPELLHPPYINCAGALWNEDNWQAVMHYHSHVTEMQYVVEGNGVVTVDGVSYACGPGDLLIFHSNQPHMDDFRDSAVSPFAYFIRFKDCHVRGLEPGRILQPGVSPVINTSPYSGQFRLYFESIYTECDAQAPLFERIVDNYLTAMVLLTLRISGSAGSEPPYRGTLASDVKDYIDKNYQSRLSIAGVAKSLNVSACHLTHVLHDVLGLTPREYLTQRRIIEAKKLLANSQLAICEIARSVGYENPSHFSTQFKHIVGVTPGQYREQNHASNDFNAL